MSWEGWNVGSVTVRRVRIDNGGTVSVCCRRHGGDMTGVIRAMLADGANGDAPSKPDGAAVTGPLASAVLSLPYVAEPVCMERALQALHRRPDMVLSLGGESFVVYCLHDGRIRKMASSSRCAAGSGEFIIQQFGRMGLDLDEGISLARGGRRVPMAARCSVHIKSDATHKLNKGECTAQDIAHTLCLDLAARIHALITATSWQRDSIIVSGGLALNGLVVDELRRLLPDSTVETLPESPYLEAYGAAVVARSNGRLSKPVAAHLAPAGGQRFAAMPPLSEHVARVERMEPLPHLPPYPGMRVLLGVDAGSTTTKAILLEAESGRTVAGCYLRTHGNPARAAGLCLDEIARQVGGCPVEIIQTAVTGSGRELVSVSLGGCLSFNEILAHARAAREANACVDTLFEIGGQDAKFVSLLAGVPVDYSMNDGCSAGTGSFLEETAASDMKCAVEEIGPLALEAKAPLAFGERCAAFINSEIRTALQGGADAKDILAGLVYSIVQNYLSRVVGTRHIGNTVLLQGGVALNPAVAPAVAALSGRRVIVPRNPELMGCEGAALMARDLLDEDKVAAQSHTLAHFEGMSVQAQKGFKCSACRNCCEIQRIRIGEEVYPFGGLCSRWEMQRRPEGLRRSEGQDLVSLRWNLMFDGAGNRKIASPQETRLAMTPDPNAQSAINNPQSPRVGLPLALLTYNLYPLYASLLAGLRCQVVLSRPGHGRRNTHAPFCYPAELLHAAVDDLLAQGVDWVFLPQVRELAIPDGHAHAYTCPFTEDSVAVIRGFFVEDTGKILAPEIGLSDHLRETSEAEICRMASRLGVPEDQARQAWRAALDAQSAFERAYRQAGRSALESLEGPVVVLVGRPYAAYAPEVNLSLPRKIASRGFHVVPADLLSLEPPGGRGNVWHFTQVATSAIAFARQRPDTYVCYLSCYSCSPDAIMHHRLRRELEGQPFCFLELDSHTADAGLDTRIGAFMDIVDQRLQTGDSSPASARSVGIDGGPAPGIDASARTPVVVTSAGQTLGFDDPRVRHVLLADLTGITSRLFASLYQAMGWRCMIAPLTDVKVLQAARRVCSGRECLPFLSMVGKLVQHLERRDPNEVTLFHLLEQEGPCQIGNWIDATSVICERLGARDAFPVWPNIRNNYLGGGERTALAVATAAVLGDLLGEVRSSLRCLARDPTAALVALDEIEERLVQAAARGLPTVDIELHRAVRVLRRIPLRQAMDRAPKVLMFSGINRIFVDRPIREFFEERGILAKTGDVGEFLCFYETEPIVRRGFELGYTAPDEQFSPRALFAGALRNHSTQPRLQALRARAHVAVIELLDRRWRRALAPSRLIFGPPIRFRELMRAGHAAVSCNGWTEAPCTAGRYLLSLEEGVYDGYVNIGAFNCTPASSATAVTHNAAAGSDLPYAVIESDGASITASQVRQLEAVAAQAWERKGRKALPSDGG